MHQCVVCGKTMTPKTKGIMVAHEFKCYKEHPDMVPLEHQEQFKSTLLWEKRSVAARKGVATRQARRLAKTG